VTPNLDEVACILGNRPECVEDMIDAARMIGVMTGTAVLLKGGHLDTPDSVTDILYTSDGTMLELSDGRLSGVNTHGSGCTLSAAIAACLAKGYGLEESVILARRYLHEGMRKALRIGNERFIAHLG
jgi:hydroxymethylpyrimidine kinase/phosphomethylpyrimidine kinase